MKTPAPLYALMLEPKVATPDDRRVALSFHRSTADAVQYFAAQQVVLSKTHHSPITEKAGKPWLMLCVVTADSCRSTAHTVTALRRKIATAQASGTPALIIEHQAATPRPDLMTNEYYKVAMQSSIDFVAFDTAPARQAAPAKKPVRNLKPRPV